MNEFPPAGLIRRLLAIVYDTIIVIALLMFVTFIWVAITNNEISPNNYYYKLLIWTVIFCFFAWFWVNGGQTLGMMAWRLKITTINNQPLKINHALMRFATAVVSLGFFGIGLFWLVFDNNKRAWHDNWSQTKLIVLPSKQKSTKTSEDNTGQ